jgi:iron complex outermembrane recepter protein
LGASIASDPDLGDIANLEVLKGPQSTLYGASTLGGLIKVVTNQPQFDRFTGEVRAGVEDSQGGKVGGNVRAVVNLPLADGIAVRAVGYYRQAGGFTDNTTLGKNDIDGSRSYGGRISLRIKPNDHLDVKLMAAIQNVDSDGSSLTSINADGKPLIDRYDQIAYLPQPSSVRYRLGNLTVSYDFGAASLTSSTSYAHLRGDQFLDYTPSWGGFYGLFPPYAVPIHVVYDTKKFSQELRLASASNKNFEWMVGGFFTHESNDNNNILSVVDRLTGVIEPPSIGNFYTTDYISKYKEYAAFANATYYITRNFDASAGIRYAHNDQSFVNPRSGTVCGACATRSNDSSEAAKTYQFAVRWRPTTDLNLYVKAASAYRPGGPVTVPRPGLPSSYASDHLWSYEAGAKTRLLDGKLLFDMAGYHIDWTDIQLNGIIGGFTTILNGGKATSDGIEVALTILPSPGLSLRANVGYNHTVLKSVPLSVTSVAYAATGDVLPYTPKLTFAVSGDYRFPLDARTQAFVGATMSYQGSKFTSYGADQLNMKIPSYAAVNLRAGVDWERYTLAFHIENLTNAFGIISAINQSLSPAQALPYDASVIRPRTFGVTGTARF